MFQFSIRSLLVATAVVAVIVWVLFVPPHVVGALVMSLLCLLLPPAILAGLIYQRGYWRAFFVGAAPWTVVLCWWISYLLVDAGNEWIDLFLMDADDALEVKLVAGPPLAIVLASGLAAVAVRWWSNRRAPHSTATPPDTSPPPA